MRTRQHVIADETTLTDAQTKEFDIAIKDPISALTVLYEATNGATSCVDKELHDDVSKIEVVDGSDVLFSLPMIEAQALNAFHGLGLGSQILTEAAAGVQKEIAHILFGRYLGDPDYYLLKSKFSNPQLRTTHALTISGTAGFATGTGKVTVIAHILEEGAPPPKGFMMAKQISAFTAATSGDEPTKLPIDYPYRLLLVKALLSTYRADEVLSNLKLSIDSDKLIPFNMRTRHLAYLNARDFGLVTQLRRLLRADAATVETDVFDVKVALANALADLHLASVDALDAEQATIQLIVVAVTPTIAKQTTITAIDLKVEGYQPHACLVYPFGRLNEPADWLDSKKYDEIKLLSSQAAAGACTINLQQARAY